LNLDYCGTYSILETLTKMTTWMWWSQLGQHKHFVCFKNNTHYYYFEFEFFEVLQISTYTARACKHTHNRFGFANVTGLM